jgi:hypothetical protein
VGDVSPLHIQSNCRENRKSEKHRKKMASIILDDGSSERPFDYVDHPPDYANSNEGGDCERGLAVLPAPIKQPERQSI